MQFIFTEICISNSYERFLKSSTYTKRKIIKSFNAKQALNCWPKRCKGSSIYVNAMFHINLRAVSTHKDGN